MGEAPRDISLTNPRALGCSDGMVSGGKSDPYFEIWREGVTVPDQMYYSGQTAAAGFDKSKKPVYSSEIVKNDLNPRWSETEELKLAE